METVGDRVRQEREAQKMSRAVLAKLIGAKGESYISELELGGIKKGGKLHRIAETLGVTVGWLETGKDPKYLKNALYAVTDSAAPMRVSDTNAAWLAYMKAPAATRAAIDLLLLPARERKALEAKHELVHHCIVQLEESAQKVLKAFKSA